jgi:pimeloyl-ACP methyl ester carboxylesterase
MSAHSVPNPGDLHDEQVVGLLRTGAHSQLLSAYFGETEYRELCEYAKLAATRSNSHGQRVYILPGIMGSKLGAMQRHVPQIIWLHPVSIANGCLLDLALSSSDELTASGVMLPGYLKLKLRLEIAGFRPIFFPFDWRRDLFDLGRALLDHIEANDERDVAIVAHSMGGLVARAALALDRHARIARVVQLGAPNAGSFAPVQALRAVYPTVRKIAALDPAHTAEELSRKVFLGLPGLYQMLPDPRCAGLDVFDPQSWPQDELQPDPYLLERALKQRERLAAADERCALIAGVNQETITSLRLKDEQFEYTITRNGDGTVPLALAEWTGALTWYVNDSHGAMTNNDTVLAAVIDLLQANTTEHLTTTAPPVDTTIVRTTTDSELRAQAVRKVHWDSLSLDTRRRILEPVISPEFL